MTWTTCCTRLQANLYQYSVLRMVKGNWERRVELVAARRQLEKSKKAEKMSGVKRISGESVLTKICNDSSLLASDSVISVWLESLPPTPICKSWLRTESCSQKKCKHKHNDGVGCLGSIEGISCDVDVGDNTEMKCDDPVDVLSVAKRDSARIRFVAVNNTCIYDHQYPDLWLEWLNFRSVCNASSTGQDYDIKPLNTLTTISELTSGDDDAVVKLAADLEKVSGPVATQVPHTNFDKFFLDHERQCVAPFGQIIVQLLPYLDVAESVRLCMTSKSMYHYCLKVEYMRARRKEGHTQFQAMQAKQKKVDKKKSIKQANTKKETKKDAFARGGNTGC